MTEVKILIENVQEYYHKNIPSSRTDSYFTHVDAVRKYSLILADKYNANRIVVEIAALLHDIGADAGRIHASKSTEMADEFLSNLGIDQDLKLRILSAIKNHSMSQSGENFEVNLALEDQIIRDADGISFLENSCGPYLKKGIGKYGNIDQAKIETINKINGMMNKIKTQEGRTIAQNFKDKALDFINNYK